MDTRTFEIRPLNDRETVSASASFRHGSVSKTQRRQPSMHRRAKSLTSSVSLLPSPSPRKRRNADEDVGKSEHMTGTPVPETPMKQSIRKRKSDEMGLVDITKIIREYEQEEEVKQDRRHFVSFDDSFNDHNSSRVILSMDNALSEAASETSRHVNNSPQPSESIFSSTRIGQEQGQGRTTRSIFDDMAFVAETFQCDFGAITGRSVANTAETQASTTPHLLSSSTSPSRLSTCSPPTVTQTPISHQTLQARSKEPSSMIKKGSYQPHSFHQSDSPCTVDGLFNNGCGSFWNRSLAWSEDEEDDSDGSDHQIRRAFYHADAPRNVTGSRSIVRERMCLSVPKQLGKEFVDNFSDDMSGGYSAPAPAKSATTGKNNFIPRQSSSASLNSYTRVKTLETDSRQRRGTKMFRQTEIDNVTEIHWEEQLVDLDSSALDLMSKLSLS